MAYKQTIVDQFVAGVEHLLRARRVSVIYGEAHLACPGFLTVLKGESNSEIPARHIILAPGKS
jgi:pyruvate/2-oxoglutarate dehydrogenase complex dihydrolipoamide dehydrogenase (E3) component